MSTFDGIVSEFPDIRIDFFRRNAANATANAIPPLACFLSHVHSDHLAGLESLRSPFVYCSAATREILLRLERYPCRINYAKGILEARQQTYKHLARVLKPLPLETPTTIELRPGRQIQVTLFDANHCVGAVMFLIEGDGKAILYTGDIRSEPWFVNSLARSPSLIEYTSGIKTLDKIYLDTSFTQDIAFQTKAEGIAELLRKVSQYPNDTVFHFQAWTYGYEDVWLALSKALKSPIHVDDYKLRIYESLKPKASENRFSNNIHTTPESPALTGYVCGNSPHPGCLTSDRNVRLHSCERGNMCEVAQRQSTVVILPVIAHLASGEDLAEVGVGGGGDDLERDAELEFLDQGTLDALMEIVSSSEKLNEEDRARLIRYLTQETSFGRNISLDIDLPSIGSDKSPQDAVRVLSEKLRRKSMQTLTANDSETGNLPKIIQFPYSRHSSYPELCDLVKIFKPKDIWPCTVNPFEWLTDGLSIHSLFGRLCSGPTFDHDVIMQALIEQQMRGRAPDQAETQRSTDSSEKIRSSPSPSQNAELPLEMQHALSRSPPSSPPAKRSRFVSCLPASQEIMQDRTTTCGIDEIGSTDTSAEIIEISAADKGCPTQATVKRSFVEFAQEGDDRSESSDSQGNTSFTSTILERHSLARRDAYYSILEDETADFGNAITLISTSDDHTVAEVEL